MMPICNIQLKAEKPNALPLPTENDHSLGAELKRRRLALEWTQKDTAQHFHLVNQITKIVSDQMNLNIKSLSFESMDGKFYGELKLIMNYASYNEVFIELNALESINSIILKDY
ncbi:hypothetical protein Q4Q35_19590 [Flavivirga aquimarina]|uniref:DUF4279 domain-containing protein n=1 Tax=Flavivirga aquimarina TaxID=2027862 RepID=A0ABT8WFT8_9FLAO|nr:hypothetical protein [Flavivirga aquimarina]MDO5972010.1 hypothetical protein [Flavivirga aquimarina]